MKKRVFIMVDLETLGTSANAPIIQIHAQMFDCQGSEVNNKFSCRIKPESLENADLDTVKWWLDTNPDLLSRLLDDSYSDDMPPILLEKTAMEYFAEWLSGYDTIGSMNDIYLIGNGVLFDNNIIRNTMERHGIKYPIKYSNDIDFRTLMLIGTMKTELKFNTDMSEYEYKKKMHEFIGEKHNAKDDVENQIELFIKTLNFILDK